MKMYNLIFLPYNTLVNCIHKDIGLSTFWRPVKILRIVFHTCSKTRWHRIPVKTIVVVLYNNTIIIVLSNLVLFINCSRYAINHTHALGIVCSNIIILTARALRFGGQRRRERCDRKPDGGWPRSWCESAWPI